MDFDAQHMKDRHLDDVEREVSGYVNIGTKSDGFTAGFWGLLVKQHILCILSNYRSYSMLFSFLTI